MAKFLEELFKFLSSLRLAVFVIVSLGVLSAIGTIYEAKYDAEYAQKVIYHSKYMYAVMSLLCTNLLFVMIDRWPWKKHHTGFICAHVGIITLIIGSLVTQKMGVDGSMAFPLGQSNRYIMVPEREILIYSSFAGGTPTLLGKQTVDFFTYPPDKKDFKFDFGKDKIVVKKYYHYAARSEKFVADDSPSAGPALRFQLQNDRVNLNSWIYKPLQKPSEKLSLGPAEIVLDDGTFKYAEGNMIVFTPQDGERVQYKIYLARKNGLIKSGEIRAGEFVPTGWMDLTLRFLKYIPKAKQDVMYSYRERPTPGTRSAISIDFNGKSHWVGLNSMLKLYSDNKVYYFTYGNRRIDTGFDMRLVKFKVGRYQGTNRAKSYASDVFVKELGEVNISMNEPLKHKGYYFYQSSFEEDESGRPTMSILSVNRDPGRVLKYLGSFLIVLGAIILFYFKRLQILDYFSKKKIKT